MSRPANVRHVHLDIEGTTSAVDFVYSVLFPYARAHMNDYVQGLLASEAGQSEFLAHANALASQGVPDAEVGVSHVALAVTLTPDRLAAQVDADIDPPDGATLEELVTEARATKMLVAKAVSMLVVRGRCDVANGRPARFVATGGEA